MTLAELRTDARFLTGTTSSTYKDSDLDFNINRALHILNAEVLNSIDGWSETEKTNSQDLVADQQSYAFPAGLIKVKRIETDFGGDGIFRHTPIIDINQRSRANDPTSINNEFGSEFPFADVSDLINLFPIPIVSVTNGLKVWYEADITELSADGDEPKITEPYQRYLSFSAANDFLVKSNQDERSQIMQQRLDALLRKAKFFYGRRIETRLTIQPASSYNTYDNLAQS